MGKAVIGTRHLAARKRAPGVGYSRDRTPVWASRATVEQAQERATRKRGAHNHTPFSRDTGEFHTPDPPKHGRGWIQWRVGEKATHSGAWADDGWHVVDMTPVDELPKRGRHTDNTDDWDVVRGEWEEVATSGTPLVKVSAGDYVARVCRNDRGLGG